LTDPDGKCVNSGSNDWLGRLTQGNCSDYPTAKEVAVGVGNFLPVFGNAIATYESTSGESLSDGHELSDTERTIAAAGIVAGPLSKVGGKVVKTLTKITKWIPNRISTRAVEHIFSKRHIADGIMDLGKNKQDILKKLNQVIDDNFDNLPQGPTLIRGKMNGHNFDMKVFRKGDKLLMVDAYKGHTPRKLNSILYLKKEY